MPLSNIVLLLVLTTISTGSFADQSSSKPKPDFNELVSQLQIDESKAQQLKVIMEGHRQQMEKVREQRQKNRAIREQHQAELLTVLSYEQLYKFEQYMRGFHPRRKSK